MKKVWSTPNLVQCDMLRSLLEGHGIVALQRNEYTAQYTGVGYPVPPGQALSFAWPEIWVGDDDAEAAEALIRDALAGEEKGSP